MFPLITYDLHSNSGPRPLREEDEVSRMTCQGNVLASAQWEAELQKQKQRRKQENRAAGSSPLLLHGALGVGSEEQRRSRRQEGGREPRTTAVSRSLQGLGETQRPIHSPAGRN